MNLGMFSMPLHRPEKPWAKALDEDREAVLLAERLGYSEVWIGEHFSTKVEQIPSPLMFFATLLGATRSIRFGTGVVNLPHHHPVVVAAEAAQFDQLSGGRLMLGVGPGGLVSDGELFGGHDMGERYAMTMESLDMILALWEARAPLRIDGAHWQVALEDNVWLPYGVGEFPRPVQRPHPPIAMAMVGPGGPTAETIAERGFIPISANFVPIENAASQWQTYAARRDALNLPADPAVWRLCRNILVTETDAEAEDVVADPDGVFAYYFRYLRGLRQMAEIARLDAPDAAELNALLDVDSAIAECVIAGSAATVLARLTDIVDTVGPFGTLVSIGHDWDNSNLWPGSMRRLAKDVMPRLGAHAAAAAR